MLINERYRTFINSMDVPLTPFLEELYERSRLDNVPVIKRETQSFLKTILAMKNPERILEVGTGTGFSALLMAQYAGKQCKVTTIENYAKRIEQAKVNIGASCHSDKIRLIAGDAADVLQELNETYDLIFMDAAKGQYINYLTRIRRIIKKGGILISDNVLQNGNIIESRYMIRRRDRTIYKRMREYLYVLKHDEEFSTSILTIGDGVALSVRL